MPFNCVMRPWKMAGARQHVTSIVGSNIALVRAGWLKEPRREMDDDVVLKAGCIVVNSREQLMQDQPGDLFPLISNNRVKLDDLAELGEVAAGKRPGRTSSVQITVHKSTAGTGAADIAIAGVAYKRAVEAGRGRWIHYSAAHR